MSCQATSTVILPTSPLTLTEADPGLNLGLSNNFGNSGYEF
jgi:hypothetical protein